MRSILTIAALTLGACGAVAAVNMITVPKDQPGQPVATTPEPSPEVVVTPDPTKVNPDEFNRVKVATPTPSIEPVEVEPEVVPTTEAKAPVVKTTPNPTPSIAPIKIKPTAPKPIEMVSVPADTFSKSSLPVNAKGFEVKNPTKFWYDTKTKTDFRGHTREGFTADCTGWYNPNTGLREKNPGLSCQKVLVPAGTELFKIKY
ncbi:MAG: hypothetical protein ACRCXZ_09485 [Patescibacteria group bacterium]